MPEPKTENLPEASVSATKAPVISPRAELESQLAAVGWEVAETTVGVKIEWETEPLLHGIYRGTDEVADENGELFKVEMFTDEHGEKRFSWSSPRLAYALREVPEGSDCMIKWLGLVKIDATRSVNDFVVAYRRPESASLELAPEHPAAAGK